MNLSQIAYELSPLAMSKERNTPFGLALNLRHNA